MTIVLDSGIFLADNQRLYRTPTHERRMRENRSFCFYAAGFMSNQNDGQKKDAYTRLKHILAVLIVFTAVAGIGFIITRDTVDAQLVSLAAQREEQNALLVEQYKGRTFP